MIVKKCNLAALVVLSLPFLLSAQQEPSTGDWRPIIGVRFESFPTRLFSTTNASSSTAKPLADYYYSAESDSPMLSLGPTVEFRLPGRVSLGAELRFHHALYKQTTQMRSGRPDPSSSTDDRQVTTITESTKANYWEVPVLARYYFAHPEPLARTYVSGGLEYRRVGRVRTGTEYAYADGVEDYNEIPAVPTRTNQIGIVAGIGVRFISRFGLRTSPELRFIHWQGTPFEGMAVRSARNQVEFGIGFSF
jgi:hypothetical protein